MGALLDTLGRSHGELIRAIDWNGLITAIEELESRMGERIDLLSGQVDARFGEVETEMVALGARLSELGERIAESEEAYRSVREELDEVRSSFRKVTLQTERLDYAMGEHALLTARITDLGGAPLDLRVAAERPWIDFVTVWGQLRAAPGYASAGGVGDRTLSVQVDAEGIAKVLLRAEHADELGEEIEAEMAAALNTKLPERSRSIAEIIREAKTPREAQEYGAFRFITTEYDRADAKNVQLYIDRYYLHTPAALAEPKIAAYLHRWRDYRSTVLAFAKGDSDPRTPDANLGACSIQVTFRDWIGPWIHLDYLAEVPTLAQKYRDLLGGVLTIDVRSSADALRDRIDQLTRGKGPIGKQRAFRAIAEGIQTVRVTEPLRHLEDLLTTVRNGVLVQQGIEYGRAVGLAAHEEVAAVTAFAGAGELIERMSTRVGATVQAQVEERLAQTTTTLQNSVRREQAEFMDTFFAEGNTFKTMQNQVQMLAGELSGVKTAVGQKADVKLVTRFLETTG